jgi:hypothetical protein
LELEYKEEYIELVSSEVHSHTVTTGAIISIILALVSSIVIVVVLRVHSLIDLTIYTILFVIVPVNVLAYVMAKRNSKIALREAREFLNAVEKIASDLNTKKVELLELTPPPYIAILKSGKYYIAISYYGYRGVYVSILDPLDVEREEGYVAVYMKKSREILARREIDSSILRIYKLVAVLPEPLEDAILEGAFYSYDFILYKLDPEKIVENIKRVFEEIRRARELYPEK